MVPVLFLFLCLISSALMDNVPIHRNLTRKSSELKSMKLLPSNLQHLYTTRSDKQTPQTNSKVNIEEPQASKCPNTDVLLKILNILTESISKTLLDPQKFKDVISTIKNILTKASVNNDVHDDLHNEVKILEDQLGKISKVDEEKIALRTQSDKNLKAKLSLQYDIPDKCEHILYALVGFINNAYNQVAKYCLVTGNCKVDDLPRIKYDTSGQIQQPFISNPYFAFGTQNTNPKYDGVYNVIKALQNLKPNLGSGSTSSQDHLSRLIQNPLQNRNVNSNNLLYNVPNKSPGSFLGLYPEWMLPDESRTEHSSDNKLPLQDLYSALKDVPPNSNNNQDFMKILSDKLKTVETSNKNKENTEDATGSDVINLLQSLGIHVLPPSKIDKPQPPSNDLELDGKNQPNQPDKQALYDSNSKNPDQLNMNDIFQLLYSIKSQTDQTGNKLLDAYSGTYVTPDTLNITPDKTKQYVQLPDLSQFSVTNQDKLNIIPNQNEVVELTYMLKRPKLAYEPLYYVKYRVPYYIFLSNLQKLLIKNPYLRNQPRKLYQELLMHSNITEAPGDLKHLEHEELVKLIATNGTLLNAKIVTENKTQDERSGEAHNSTQNLITEAKTKVDPLSFIETLVKLANNDSSERHFNQRIGLNPYLSYGYPSKTKLLYQSGLNYNPSNLLSNSLSANAYGRPSVYRYNGINSVLPSNEPSYSMYASGYQTG